MTVQPRIRATNAVSQNVTNATIAAVAPTNRLAGDLLLMLVLTASTANVATPAGWASGGAPVAVSTGKLYAFTRTADNTATDNPVLALTPNSTARAITMAIIGADTAAPVDVYATSSDAVASATGTAPAVTPASVGALLVSAYGFVGANTFIDTISTDAPDTRVSPIGSNTIGFGGSGNAGALGVYARVAPNTASQGGGSLIGSQSATAHLGLTIGIKPAASSTPQLVGVAAPGSGWNASGTPINHTPATPGTPPPQAGELVVVELYTNGTSDAATTVNTPTGWSPLGTPTKVSGEGLLFTFYKVWAGGDTMPSFTINNTGGVIQGTSRSYLISGNRATSPIDAVATNTTAAGSATYTPPTITPTSAGDLDMVIQVEAVPGGGGIQNNYAVPGSIPAGYTPIGNGTDLTNSGAWSRALAASGASAGVVGPTLGGGSYRVHSVRFAVAQANRAPGAPGVPSVAPDPVNANGTITWTAATDPDGDGLTYDVEVSTNNGGSWSVIAAGVASGTVYDFTAQPSTTTGKLRVRAKDTSGVYGPYATMAGNFTIAHNFAPTAPDGLAPNGGSSTVVDRAAINRLSWVIHDPDPGDTQGSAEVRWRIGAGAWTTTAVPGSNWYYDVPANTFAAADYEWQVRTYDALGLVSPWSASAFFTAATAPAAPVITSPVNNAGIPAPTGLIAWTAAAQTAYRVRKVADLAGAPDTSTVYFDSGIVVSTTARDYPLTFPVNNRTEHLQVQVRNNGLWSTWASVREPVAYSTPAVPLLGVAALPNNVPPAIDVAVTNPTPTGSQPAVTRTELWRRVVGSAGAGERLVLAVAGGSYRDTTPTSGVAYEYQAVAFGNTGTQAASAWTG